MARWNEGMEPLENSDTVHVVVEVEVTAGDVVVIAQVEAVSRPLFSKLDCVWVFTAVLLGFRG